MTQIVEYTDQLATAWSKYVKRSPKARPDCPDQWGGTDITTVVTDLGWTYVVIVLDCYTKKIVSHHAGSQAKSYRWLLPLDRAVQLIVLGKRTNEVLLIWLRSSSKEK